MGQMEPPATLPLVPVIPLKTQRFHTSSSREIQFQRLLVIPTATVETALMMMPSAALINSIAAQMEPPATLPLVPVIPLKTQRFHTSSSREIQFQRSVVIPIAMVETAHTMMPSAALINSIAAQMVPLATSLPAPVIPLLTKRFHSLSSREMPRLSETIIG